MLNVIYNCIADLIRVFNFFNFTVERSLGIYYLNMQCFSSPAIYFNFAIADSLVKNKWKVFPLFL